MRSSNIDLSRRLNSWLTMIWWYFLEIALMRFEIFQKLPKKSTIVIHPLVIFSIFVIAIWCDFQSGFIELLIEYWIEKLVTIRSNFLWWIIFLPILRMCMIGSFLFVILRVRFSILRPTSVILCHGPVIARNEAIQKIRSNPSQRGAARNDRHYPTILPSYQLTIFSLLLGFPHQNEWISLLMHFSRCQSRIWFWHMERMIQWKMIYLQKYKIVKISKQ